MDTTQILETRPEQPAGTVGTVGATRVSRLAHGWSLQRVLAWLCPAIALFMVVIAVITPGYSSHGQLSGLLSALVAAPALALAPRWPYASLALLLLSALVWLIPTVAPLAQTGQWLAYIAVAYATLLAIALRTFLPTPTVPLRRLAPWTAVAGVILTMAWTAGDTVGVQLFAIRDGGKLFWTATGPFPDQNDPAVTAALSPLNALLTRGPQIFGGYALGLAAVLLSGWLLSLIIATRRGRLDGHPWLGSTRLVTSLQRPRSVFSLLTAIAFALFGGAAVVQNAYSAPSAWLTAWVFLPLALGATIAPLRPRAGTVLVGVGCLVASIAGFAFPWFAAPSAASLVFASVVAILLVLLNLPSGRSWWWIAAALVLLGAALFTPATATQNQAQAQYVAFSAALDRQPTSDKDPTYPDEHAWATMSEDKAAELTKKYEEMDRLATEAANKAAWSEVGDSPYGGPATITAAFVQVLPLFLLPAILAWGLKLAASVTVERRRVAQARAELEASEKGRALQDERRGIAGDVHDVLAHSLTVIVAQGEGALVTRGAEQQDAVRRMVDVARASLRDVRALIERLDGEDTDLPSPGLENLPALLQNVRDAGLSLTSEEFGERLPLGDSTELALYRILQEALTNVLSHGGRGASACLVLDWRGEDPGLSVTLASSGGDGSGASHGNGLGIEGMRTRAAVAGGWLTAGPDDARLASGAHCPVAGTHPGDAPLGSGARPTSGEQLPDGAADAGRGWLVTAFLPAVAQSVGALR